MKKESISMILETLQQYTAEYPNVPILFDDAHSKGITYTQFDEMTGKVYTWLKEQGIINSARGSLRPSRTVLSPAFCPSYAPLLC